MEWLRHHAPFVADVLGIIVSFVAVIGIPWAAARSWWNRGARLAALEHWREDHSTAADDGFSRLGRVEAAMHKMAANLAALDEREAEHADRAERDRTELLSEMRGIRGDIALIHVRVAESVTAALRPRAVQREGK